MASSDPFAGIPNNDGDFDRAVQEAHQRHQAVAGVDPRGPRRTIVTAEPTPEWWILVLSCGHTQHGTSHFWFEAGNPLRCMECKERFEGLVHDVEQAHSEAIQEDVRRYTLQRWKQTVDSNRSTRRTSTESGAIGASPSPGRVVPELAHAEALAEECLVHDVERAHAWAIVEELDRTAAQWHLDMLTYADLDLTDKVADGFYWLTPAARKVVRERAHELALAECPLPIRTISDVVDEQIAHTFGSAPRAQQVIRGALGVPAVIHDGEIRRLFEDMLAEIDRRARGGQPTRKQVVARPPCYGDC